MKNLFSEHDIVACIGDSNTSAEVTQTAYLQFIQYIYRTRFPEKSIRFLNRGIAGDTYGDALRRMEWDILTEPPTQAIIQLGVNDVEYQKYPRFDAQNLPLGVDRQKIGEIRRFCGKLIHELLRYKITPTLLLPGGFYEAPDHPHKVSFRGANEAIQELAAQVKLDCAQEGVRVIDLFPVFEKMRQTIPAITMTPDRIHFCTIIHLLMAVAFAQGQGLDPLVCSARIGEASHALRADVKNVRIDRDSVSFHYEPKSLPFYDSAVYRQLESYFPITELINGELIAVNELPQGQYQLFLDEKAAGTYSSEALSSGINIALLESNPNRKMSAELYRLLCTDWYKPMHDLRRLSYQIEHCKERGIDLQQIPQYEISNKNGMDPAFLDFAGDLYPVIIELFKNRELNEQKLAELWQQACQMEVPRKYTVRINRIQK